MTMLAIVVTLAAVFCGTVLSAVVTTTATPNLGLTFYLMDVHNYHYGSGPLKLWLISTETELTLPITDSQLPNAKHYHNETLTEEYHNLDRAFQVTPFLNASTPQLYNEHSSIVIELWDRYLDVPNKFVAFAAITIEQLKKTSPNVVHIWPMFDAQSKKASGMFYFMWQHN